MMKYASVAIGMMMVAGWGRPTAAAERPNIVLIFADDLGWKDTGYNGSDFYETPNIDRLASEGMVFTNAYAGGGNCCPSRACLISGQYTPRHSVYAVGSTKRGPVSLMRMVPVPNLTYLEPQNVTVAEALKAAGYATGCFGKWHLGSRARPETMPDDQGFDTVMDRNYKGSGARDDPKGIYTITRAACEFIERNHRQGRPFFAYVSHHAIHVGLQARPETLKRFEAKEPGKQHDNALYAACTYDLDDGVGILLNKLKELGIQRETLVVFTSDNGGTGQSSQEPLRGSKGCYYEGGIREPFIVHWPGVVRPGSQCDVPVINEDLYPTFLDVAGAPVPPGKVLDGESIRPLFEETGALKRQAIFWHFPGYLNGPVPRGRDPVFRTRPVSVIRKGDWKLHLYHEEWQLDGGREAVERNHAVELYNLADDIGERHNLANERADKRDELLDDLLTWFKQIGAVLPSQRNAGYDPTKPLPKPQRKSRRRKKPGAVSPSR